LSLRTRKLPPVRALVAFEAAGRHRNFTRAGEELLVTRVAVSRQIKLLEEHLGIALFHREPRNLRLTAGGERLYSVINHAFDRIVQVAEELHRDPTDKRITITTTPAAANYLLMPRIGRFRATHPDIDFRIESTLGMSDLTRDGVQLAIRYGPGSWPGTRAELLDYQMVIPTCSSGYFNERTKLESPEQLLDEKLLHLETAYDPGHTWPVWFREHGVKYRENHRQTRFTDFTNLVQALLDGQGIGLVGPPLVRQFYDNRMLSRALDLPLVQLQGFYLTWPSDSPPTPPVRTFMNWIRRELKRPDIT
jgi:LysR family glycine cleavage system transcriptional activator